MSHFTISTLVSLALLLVSKIGNAGYYTQAYESTVTRTLGNFTCSFNQKGGIATSHNYQIEVGSSVGPSGTTRHYESRTTVYTPMKSYICSQCGKEVYELGYPPKRVTIKNNGNTQIMTINGGAGNSLTNSMCSKPKLNEVLVKIYERAGKPCYGWESSLAAMWKAARELDIEEADKLEQEQCQKDPAEEFYNSEIRNENAPSINKYVVERESFVESVGCCIQ